MQGWKNTYKLIRNLQPDIVIWNDGEDRGDLRWVGTEAGYVGETNWSLLNATESEWLQVPARPDACLEKHKG